MFDRELISENSLKVSMVVYLIAITPLYFWIKGPIGSIGTIQSSVAGIGLLLPSIVVVPLLSGYIKRRTRAMFRKEASDREQASEQSENTLEIDV